MAGVFLTDGRMIFARVAWAGFLGLVLLSAPVAAQGIAIGEGQWLGEDLRDRDGRFERCQVETARQGEVALRLAVDAGRQVRLSLSAPSWRLDASRAWRGSLGIDGRRWPNLPFTVSGPSTLETRLAAPVAAALAAGETLTLGFGDRRFRYDLRGSARALAALRACAERALAATTVDPAAREAMDWKIGAVTALKQDHLDQPTPVSLPGGGVIRTRDLLGMIGGPARPVLLDVRPDGGGASLPGAVRLDWAGAGGGFADAVQTRLGERLSELTGHDPARRLIFFDAGPESWRAYNAGLRAIRLGYRDVVWYRGGTEAWGRANLPMVAP